MPNRKVFNLYRRKRFSDNLSSINGVMLDTNKSLNTKKKEICAVVKDVHKSLRLLR